MTFNLFLVKGQTVTPQHRPPPGSLPLRETKKDDTSYKGWQNELDYQQTIKTLMG